MPSGQSSILSRRHTSFIVLFFNHMNRLLTSFFLLLALGGCAQVSTPQASVPATMQASLQHEIAPFSINPAGTLPHGWEPMIILRTKKPTQYQLVTENNTTVLHAQAIGASSGLMQKVDIDPFIQPWLHWDWKIDSLIKTANNDEHTVEDSPVRIILGFDGDKDTLPFTDQILFETAKIVTGYDFPYATLMYIWENKAPVGTVVASSRSGRIKMMVAASGPDGIGQWLDFSRNIVEDYKKAFGENPGKLIGVGVLTDTDNTGETVEAWYGDIRLKSYPK
jgi:Protein of unknown function (DUF3047)